MSERSPELNALAKALCNAQGEFPTIPKGDVNPFFKSKYAGLPAVIEASAPILAKHGLTVSQHLGFDGTNDLLTTYLMHESGQFISETMRLHLVKSDPQGHGSATTYARRYSYMAVLGLVADEDDDGNKANQSGPAPARRPASTVRRATRPTPPPSDEDAPEPDMPLVAVDLDQGRETNLISQPQMAKMQILFKEKGFHNRDDCLAYVRDIHNIDVQSSKELTRRGATAVIEALLKLDNQP